MALPKEIYETYKEKKEHILVGLSPAPSNQNLVETAAKLANAFQASFTALYVKTPKHEQMSTQDKQRLKDNIAYAEKLGATIITILGDDVPLQIAEYARLAGVSKIVIGRSAATKKKRFGKPTLVDLLIATAPNIDIHIILDSTNKVKEQRERHQKRKLISPLKDLLISLSILIVVSLIGCLFAYFGFIEANIITLYILGILVISVVTNSRICWGISALVSVFIFIFLFTEPRFSFLTQDKGYSATVLIMFITALITGSLSSKMKNHARETTKAGYRTKILFETNQFLQKANNEQEIIDITAKQINKLLNRVVMVCKKDDLEKPLIYGENCQDIFLSSEMKKTIFQVIEKKEKIEDNDDEMNWDFFPICSNKKIYGVVGIIIDHHPLDSFENSIISSIIGECFLALQNNQNAKEKERAAILAKDEKLRANLLRSISHDLRTPLTAIAGNANNLFSNGDSFDEQTKQQIYAAIYDDSMWLINLVENLLSITRLEEGKMNINFSAEIVDEVIAEALKHISRKENEHHILFEESSEMILARMDARLIIQVIINLVDNAIKYTPKGSNISIRTEKKEHMIMVHIADDGPGIAEELKPKVFEMFFTGSNKISDSKRSLGLGLSLCKTIINVHGGEIVVQDNVPHGSIFTFSLPIQEVEIHE